MNVHTPPANTLTDLEPAICDLTRKTRVAMRAVEGMAAEMPDADNEALVDFLEQISILADQLREEFYASI